MRYFHLHILIFFIWVVTIAAQDTAQVSFPFLLYDNAGGQRLLYFGVDSTATDSIDTHLGESDLPPFPPVGIFEARWILPQNGFNGSLSSYSDYRYGGGAVFADTIEYRLKYQGSEGADTMFFQWNFPAGITARLQDLITGNIVNVFMSDSGIFGLTNFNVLDQMKLLVFYDIVPVELISFIAEVNGSSVTLNWSTATELNNQGFVIERKILKQVQNDNWEKIGFVPGYGTTTEPKEYSFLDKNILTGTYTYRLKQIDYDGSFEYSNEIEVEINLTPSNFTLYQNYPNPFNPTTAIKYSLPEDSRIRISIYNILGELINIVIDDMKTAGTHIYNLDATNFSSGVYYYQMDVTSSDNKEKASFIKKMVILK